MEISINMNFNIIIETVGASSSMAHFDYSELVLSKVGKKDIEDLDLEEFGWLGGG